MAQSILFNSLLLLDWTLKLGLFLVKCNHTFWLCKLLGSLAAQGPPRVVSRPTEVVAAPEGSLVGRVLHQMVDWPLEVVDGVLEVVDGVLEVVDVVNCTLVDLGLPPMVEGPMEVVDQLGVASQRKVGGGKWWWVCTVLLWWVCTVLLCWVCTVLWWWVWVVLWWWVGLGPCWC